MNNVTGEAKSKNGFPTRSLSGREVAGALLIVLVLLAAMTLASLGYRWVGYLAIAGAMALAIGSVRRMSPQERARLSDRIEAQQKSGFGRLLQFVQIVAFLLLAVAVARWVAGQW